VTAAGAAYRTDPLEIELGWPAEELSPNSRAHYMVKSRFKKAARTEAGWATKLAQPGRWSPPEGKIPVRLVAHPPKAWRTGDDDNLVARVKSHLDGIADVLDINDRDFAAPTVTWADRCDRGRLVILIGGVQ
jgi:crossover junction endodeoxyribonuclease RusA